MGVSWHYLMLLWSAVIFDIAKCRDSSYCAKFFAEDPNVCEEATFLSRCRATCANHKLTCYSCPSVSHPSKCTNQTKCLDNEVCVVTQAFNSNFDTVYRLGCISQEECKLFTHEGDFRRSATLLGDCCSHSNCNHYRPESLKEKLECYNCNETDHPLRCKTTTECAAGQLCVVTRAINANFELTYRQGCMDRHTCDGFVHDGIPHARSTVPLSGDCCETDKCNKYDHPHKSECKDLLEKACPRLLTKEPKFCNNNDMIRFCPKTCGQCVNCYQCSSQNESLENCTSKIKCDVKSGKACVIKQTNRHGIMDYARTCLNHRNCHSKDSSVYCCKTENCNDNFPITTTAQPTTAKPSTSKPTTTSTAKPTTSKPTTTSTAKPTTSKPTTTSTAKPTTSKPTTVSTAKPTTSKPTTTSTAKPTTNKPTTTSTAKPTTSKPTTTSTAIPTTSKPTTASTAKPTTSKPTTAKPATSKQTTTVAPTIFSKPTSAASSTPVVSTTSKFSTTSPTSKKSTQRPWFTVPVATPSPTKIWFTIPPATTAKPWFTIPTNAPQSTPKHVWITVPLK